MIPPTILQQLSRLRREETRARFVWGAARWLALVVVVLALACLTDWLVDRRQDTPWELRQGMLIGQAVLWVVAAAVLLVAPLLRRRSASELALYVEERVPDFGHRLITAVQLNRPGADLRGMSPGLLAAATRQAEEQAARLDFTDLADRRPLHRGSWLAFLVVLAAGLFLLAWPGTVLALLARQFLADREIPRAVALADRSRPIWPGGEEITLEFDVLGPVAEDWQGEVRIDPDGGRPVERYALRFASHTPDGTARFVAKVPSATTDFSYLAWLADGRTRQPSRIRVESRPVVQQLEAWVRLPGACGYQVHPLDALPANLLGLPVSCLAAEPFEEDQKGADIVHRLPGSGARVRLGIQKPVVSAALEIIKKAESGEETTARVLPLALSDDMLSAETTFLPGPGESAYRVVVHDEHGFENLDRPRRAIRAEPPDPPQVALLPEYFSRIDSGPSDEYEVEGLPVLLGERIRIGYRCATPYGLSRAQLRYRVISEDEFQFLGEDGVRKLERDWDTLPLQEVDATDESGPFDPRRGVFAYSGRNAQVGFHAVPSVQPDVLGGTVGGGRFDFQTQPLTITTIRPEFPAILAAVPDVPLPLGLPWAAFLLSQEKRQLPVRPLQAGDRVEFYVEAYDRNPDPNKEPGRSELRRKTVVTQAQLFDWLVHKDDQKQRVRDLEQKQRIVFGGPTAPEEARRPEVLPGFTPSPPPVPFYSSRNYPFGRSWHLLGPFPDPDGTAHDHVYPPELEPVTLGREYDGANGKIRWKQHLGVTDKVDLEKLLGHEEAGAAYAVCWFLSPKRQPAILTTGSDDGIKVWVDRRLVLDKAAHREAAPGDDRTPLELRGGWTELLVKVDNRFGSWAFYVGLEDPTTSKPLPGVLCRILPQGKPISPPVTGATGK